MTTKFATAIAAFDRANEADPNVEEVDGTEVPRELAYARRMSAWLDRLYPEASEALRLAVRCQHIERWTSPRKSYPDGRVGYLTWRRDLKTFHAERAGEILREVGYGEDIAARVGALVRKERLKQDPEAQALEDVVCLVFLESYFSPFARQHDPAKVVDIVRKTWRKMSGHGQAAALELPLDAESRALVEEAVAGG